MRKDLMNRLAALEAGSASSARLPLSAEHYVGGDETDYAHGWQEVYRNRHTAVLRSDETGEPRVFDPRTDEELAEDAISAGFNPDLAYL